MDTRSLIALGMVLAVAVVALVKGALDGPAVKDLLIMLGSGIIGFTMPRGQPRPGPAAPITIPPAAVMVLLVGGLWLLIGGCLGTAPPPDPTAPPPSVTLPRDPLAPPFTPFYQHADGGTDR